MSVKIVQELRLKTRVQNERQLPKKNYCCLHPLLILKIITQFLCEKKFLILPKIFTFSYLIKTFTSR